MSGSKKGRTQAKPERARRVPRLGLVLLWHWRERNAHVFPSDSSLRWHLDKHRDEYLAAGALLELAGRSYCDPPKFEAVLREIGVRQASSRHEGEPDAQVAT